MKDVCCMCGVKGVKSMVIHKTTSNSLCTDCAKSVYLTVSQIMMGSLHTHEDVEREGKLGLSAFNMDRLKSN